MACGIRSLKVAVYRALTLVRCRTEKLSFHVDPQQEKENLDKVAQRGQRCAKPTINKEES
jgi:hypothetical protein